MPEEGQLEGEGERADLVPGGAGDAQRVPALRLLRLEEGERGAWRHAPPDALAPPIGDRHARPGQTCQPGLVIEIEAPLEASDDDRLRPSVTQDVIDRLDAGRFEGRLERHLRRRDGTSLGNPQQEHADPIAPQTRDRHGHLLDAIPVPIVDRASVIDERDGSPARPLELGQLQAEAQPSPVQDADEASLPGAGLQRDEALPHEAPHLEASPPQAPLHRVRLDRGIDAHAEMPQRIGGPGA